MAADHRTTILSPNLEEYRSVEDVRRFAVFSNMLSGSLQEHYSADFTVMFHTESPNGFSSFKSSVLTSVGSVPDSFEDQMASLVKSYSNTSGDFKFETWPEAECLVHRLAVTDCDAIVFVLGFQSINLPNAETRQRFAESLEKIQSEISDIFLISQQAQKIDDLRRRLENAEDQLDSPVLDLSRGIEHLEIAGESKSVIGVNTCSQQMKTVLNQISKIGLSDLSLLIRGEVGTGKAFLARKIHDHSSQKDSPFEMISCGALTPSLVEGELFGWKKGAFSGADEDRAGLFERANGGTVFLDEVS
ncbi:MAG: sigma 54-interacting transcriptional regulator, partial [Planctomycetota bacterium]